MAIALVASTSFSVVGSGSGGTTSAINAGGANLGVVVVGLYNGGGATVSVGDSNGNTWTQRVLVRTPTIGFVNAIWDCVGGSFTNGMTVTVSGINSAVGFAVAFYSGVATSPLDGSNSNTSGLAPTTIQTGSLTPSQNGDLIIAGLIISDGQSGSVSIDSSFTIRQQTPNVSSCEGVGLADLIQSTAGAVNPTWSGLNGTLDYGATIAAYKAPSTAGAASMSAVGAASMAGVGHSRVAGAMSAAGVATMAPAGKLLLRTAMSATGAATFAGVGKTIRRTAMSATGAASMSAVGAHRMALVMTALGAASFAGVGKTLRLTSMAAPGAASMSCVGRATMHSVWSAAGAATMAPVGRSHAAGVMTATGIAVMSGNTGGTITKPSAMSAVGAAVMAGATRMKRNTAMTALGAASLAAVGRGVIKSILSAVGAATFAPAGRVIARASAAINGAATMAATARVTAPTAATMAGAASMVAVTEISGIVAGRMVAVGAASMVATTLPPQARPCNILEGGFRVRCLQGACCG